MSNHSHSDPPKLPLKFLRWFCRKDLIEDVEGDLEELFASRLEVNQTKAKLRFLLDVLLLLRPEIIGKFKINNGLINFSMLKNYIKIALRNALRYKGYTALNLMGLVVGIASSLLILLWVNDEVQVDKFHANGDNIYQLFRNMKQSAGSAITTSSIPKPAADLVKAEYSEVKEVAMLSWLADVLIMKNDKAINEEGRMASPEFINMFTFPLLVGDKETALSDLNAILISKSIAEKHFGSTWKENVLGESLRIDDERDVIITGVFDDVDDNSSLQFSWLLPIQYFINENAWVDNWGNGSFSIYMTIENEEDLAAVKGRIVNEINDHTQGLDNAGDELLMLHKFQDFYLYSNFENGEVDGGRIEYVKIMSIVALFILIIACINFMNLATARSGRRSKEIGLRKVMGSHKSAISLQFFIEAFMLSAIAVIISVVLVLILLPYFSELVQKPLSLDFGLLQTWYFLGGVTLVVGLLSGSYPALLLPTFSIISSLKGSVKQGAGASFFRKGLVVFQFGMSVLLIIGTTVIYQQMDYILNKDIGIEKENLVSVSLKGDLNRRFDTYKTELKKIAEVTEVTISSGNPINYGRSTSSATWEGKDPTKGYEVNVIVCDEDFVETMGIQMAAGRNFSKDYADSSNFLINEVAVGLMGFDDPINKSLSIWGIKGRIVGVVKNFHMSDMHQPISPLIITSNNPMERLALIRLKGNNNGESIQAIESLTKEMNPSFDFEYEFIDKGYEESYQSEMTVSSLANIFAGISIFISCLGLFGLSAFSAEQRSKEIGVRKVHGASVSQLVILLSKDYSKLMILAFVIAIPFAYIYAQQWLDNFEFRTYLNPVFFVLAGIFTFIVGALTVSFKSFQAARVNPAKTLKDE